MDHIKIGKFIAKLRKEKGLTQEQIGEMLGVTNKTVSRWETGTYLPPADMLVMMSELFEITINEILSGKRLSQEEYQIAAEENLQQAISSSSFTLKEKIDYFKQKWLKEHIAIMVFVGICILTIFIIAFLKRSIIIGYIAIIMLLLAHGWRNNTMMRYVENNAFDGTGS